MAPLDRVYGQAEAHGTGDSLSPSLTIRVDRPQLSKPEIAKLGAAMKAKAARD